MYRLNPSIYPMILFEAGVFTGAFVGMQCQDTSGERLPADFHYFRYEETDE